MAGGSFKKERGLRKSNERVIGFGKSVILQGALLLGFDGVIYSFHLALGKELPELVQNISLGPTGVHFRMNF
jgi:hypothetical protein